MDEIVQAVSEKTGLPESQAKQAVDTVVSVLKERLPEPLAAQVDAVLAGKSADLGNLGKSLGGFLGKR